MHHGFFHPVPIHNLPYVDVSRATWGNHKSSTRKRIDAFSGLHTNLQLKWLSMAQFVKMQMESQEWIQRDVESINLQERQNSICTRETSNPIEEVQLAKRTFINCRTLSSSFVAKASLSLSPFDGDCKKETHLIMFLMNSPATAEKSTKSQRGKYLLNDNPFFLELKKKILLHHLFLLHEWLVIWFIGRYTIGREELRIRKSQ